MIGFERNAFEESGLLQMPDGISSRLLPAIRVAYLAEVVRVHHSERSNRGERFALGTIQVVRSFPVAHQLAVGSSRKIELSAEDVPSTVLADAVSVAHAA